MDPRILEEARLVIGRIESDTQDELDDAFDMPEELLDEFLPICTDIVRGLLKVAEKPGLVGGQHKVVSQGAGALLSMMKAGYHLGAMAEAH